MSFGKISMYALTILFVSGLRNDLIASLEDRLKERGRAAVVNGVAEAIQDRVKDSTKKYLDKTFPQSSQNADSVSAACPQISVVTSAQQIDQNVRHRVVLVSYSKSSQDNNDSSSKADLLNILTELRNIRNNQSYDGYEIAARYEQLVKSSKILQQLEQEAGCSKCFQDTAEAGLNCLPPSWFRSIKKQLIFAKCQYNIARLEDQIKTAFR